MNYKIKEENYNENLINSNLSIFEKKVLATYDNKIINDYLLSSYQDIIFDNMNAVIDKINEHIKSNHKIVIIGDYDCDGILGTSILVKAFAKIGIKVGYYIPNRLCDGYGLNKEMVQMFKDKDYQLIISVDNGIKAKPAIEYAYELGMDVIISDHHHIDEDDLCENTLYLHPTLSNIDYAISGGLVAYYLAKSLINAEDNYLKTLAAITLLSDVMPIMKNNRLLIKECLLKDIYYPQILLLTKNKLSIMELNNNVIPKINAIGRLADKINPNKLVQYFCTNNKEALLSFSKTIEKVNDYRKELSNEYFNKYKNNVPKDNLIFIEDNTIHEGIIGLLATRLAHEKNCIVLIASHNNGFYKASIRSIKQINIYDIVIQLKHLLENYGGHQQAMGITYKEENSNIFKKELALKLSQIIIEDDTYEVIELNKDELTLTNAFNLAKLEPFGNNFSRPLFIIKNAQIIYINTLKSMIHHKIIIKLDNEQFELMLFNHENISFDLNNNYDFIVEMSINNFRNIDKLQLVIINYDLS
ncbi:MAG: DHH family phosphoesterase [Bacilli bacterium]|jgi:single-stranded-DNA-specific exonuclease|nr:DHH family phosphoesterase [Bacilli bacterium]